MQIGMVTDRGKSGNLPRLYQDVRKSGSFLSSCSRARCCVAVQHLVYYVEWISGCLVRIQQRVAQHSLGVYLGQSNPVSNKGPSRRPRQGPDMGTMFAGWGPTAVNGKSERIIICYSLCGDSTLVLFHHDPQHYAS